MSVRQGDIYWVEIQPEETVGSEQYKRRPFVIVSRSDLNRGQNNVVGVPLSTKVAKACAHRILIPVAEIIKDPGSNSVVKNSVALTDQIRVLDKSRLEEPRIGYLSQTATIGVVEVGLAYLFDIPIG